MDARVATGVPLGDALDALKDYAARTMQDGKSEERSAIALARRNTRAMQQLGVAAALGIGKNG